MDTGFVLTIIFSVIAFVFLFFQLYTSYYLLGSQAYSKQKKFKHLLIVWCLPLVGGLLVLNWMLPEEIEIPNFNSHQNTFSEKSIDADLEKRHPRDHEIVL